MSRSKNYAHAFGAAKLKDVCDQAGFAFVYAQLDAGKRQQLQNWMDSLVVNPAVSLMADQIIRNGTYLSEWGRIWMVKPSARRQAERMLADMIPVDRRDDRVQLDAKALLDAKAFALETDNPDEADYMQRVRGMLDRRGVWLRFATKWKRSSDDPSRLEKDARHFEIWLSLGPDGDAIPTQGGHIDRKALLGTQIIGAGYFTNVDEGRVERELDTLIRKLSAAIDEGMAEHERQRRVRSEAGWFVTRTSDALGGATFPSPDMWLWVHKGLIHAMNLKNQGKTYGARAVLIVVAIDVRRCARTLDAYIEDTTSGAGRAVTVLKVAKTAGEVAEVALTLTSLGSAALARAGVRTGARAAERVAVNAGEKAAEKAAEDTVERIAEIEMNNYINANRGTVKIDYVPMPKSTAVRNIGPKKTPEIGEGFDKW